MDRTERRLLLLWSLLLAITLLSWSSLHATGWLKGQRLQETAVIILAFVKVRVVMLDFMNVRSAPIALRLGLDAWVVAICSGLIALVFVAGHGATR